MAGLGWRTWTRQTLSAAFLQGYLQDQVVQVYPSSNARAAVKAVPDDGMVSVLTDGHGIPDVGIAGGWRPVNALLSPVVSSVSFATASTTEQRVTGALNVARQLYAGRLYRVNMVARADADVAASGEVAIRGRIGTPVNTDPLIAFDAVTIGTPGRQQKVMLSGKFGVAASGSYTLSPFLRRNSASGTITLLANPGGVMELGVEDVGPWVAGHVQL